MQLIHGDCLEKMNDIPDKSIDMILCDLPYGTTACKWDVVIPFEPLWEQYKRIIKDRGAIVLFASQPFASALVMSNIEWFKYEWVWDKVVGSNFVNSKRMPLKANENILVFYNKQPTYNPIMEDREKKNERKSGKSKIKENRINGVPQIVTDTTSKPKYPINIIRVNRLNKELNSKYVIHPTQKPIQLLEYLIKTYTIEGETVLDNTMGSGSTGISCLNTNRNFIGIEKDDKYFEVAKKRIEETKC